MNKSGVDGMLGLAMRAGKLVSGSFSVEKAIKSGKAYLVVIAGDASEETKKGLTDACNYYKKQYMIYSTKENLGRILGREYRACAAILDEKFAEAVLDKYRQ